MTEVAGEVRTPPPARRLTAKPRPHMMVGTSCRVSAYDDAPIWEERAYHNRKPDMGQVLKDAIYGSRKIDPERGCDVSRLFHIFSRQVAGRKRILAGRRQGATLCDMQRQGLVSAGLA